MQYTCTSTSTASTPCTKFSTGRAVPPVFFQKKKIHESYQRIFSGVRPENLRYALGTLERFSIAVGFVTFFADATKKRYLPLRVNDSVIDA